MKAGYTINMQTSSIYTYGKLPVINNNKNYKYPVR